MNIKKYVIQQYHGGGERMNTEYMLCKHCGKPLLDNDLVKNAYKSNNTWAWALKRLDTIIQMMEDEHRKETQHLTLASNRSTRIAINALLEVVRKVSTLADWEVKP